MPKYKRQNLQIKGEIDNPIRVGDFNILLSIINKTIRHKINK